MTKTKTPEFLKAVLSVLVFGVFFLSVLAVAAEDKAASTTSLYYYKAPIAQQN